MKRLGSGMGPWDIPALTAYFMWRILIQNQPKLSPTKKWWNGANSSQLNSLRLGTAKTSMSKFLESLKYINCYSLSRPRSIKCPSNSNWKSQKK